MDIRGPAAKDPPREWLKGLPEVERHVIGKDLLRAQWSWPVWMPLCRPLGDRLWEIRTDLPTKKTSRVLLCVYRDHSGGVARIHQENTQDSISGFRDCANAKKELEQ